ncbi:MAG: S8 family serine peptidase, partial [Chloroflexi bacterium]|nr:S8 family serine peptidase [Chloroflexota bacterium]
MAKDLAEKGEATFFVLLDQQADLAPAYGIADWNQRGRFVLQTLQRTATDSQAPLLALLQQRQTSAGDVLGFQPFYIVNTVLVSARSDAVAPILGVPGVARIAANQVLTIPTPQPAAAVGPTAVEWGISKVGADAVWSQTGVRGNGIVVANIDTGVQLDHPALVRQYRGRKSDGTFDHNYNWWDPAKICGNPSLAPCDNNNHGTHTMGTMVGDDGGNNRIGVAPDATWIAAKGCESSYCTTASLISAGQWILAPTNLAGQSPDPAKRPHIVNNSWGGGSGSLFYAATVQAWHAAGIFPAFAAGNSGSGCSTASSPGDYPLSFATGATNGSDAIAGFSSRGPAYWGGTKPDVAAPGVGVRSSVANNGYASYQGTSMASPHSAGLVALVWSAGPQLIGR